MTAPVATHPLECYGCKRIITKGQPYTRTDDGRILCAGCCHPAPEQKP